MARLGMIRNKAGEMLVIGLTGGMGSGKTSVACMLARRGGYVIDADRISREVMSGSHAGYSEVIRAFGNVILDAEQNIDRKKLGEIVFSDPAEKKKLEEIVHKYILKEIKDRILKIKAQPGAYEFIVLDAPLLIETGLKKDVDTVWLMRADSFLRLKRVEARDRLNPEQIEKRMAGQSKFEDLMLYADEIIDNDHDLGNLETRVIELLNGMEGGRCTSFSG